MVEKDRTEKVPLLSPAYPAGNSMLPPESSLSALSYA